MRPESASCWARLLALIRKSCAPSSNCSICIRILRSPSACARSLWTSILWHRRIRSTISKNASVCGPTPSNAWPSRKAGSPLHAQKKRFLNVFAIVTRLLELKPEIGLSYQAEKFPRARVFARLKDLFGTALLDDYCPVHEDDMIGNFAGKAHFVRYHNHRHALFRELAHYPQNFAD